MNTKLDGKISFDEFVDFCKLNPSAIDFLGRITIGPYPMSAELVEKLKSEGLIPSGAPALPAPEVSLPGTN